MRTIHFAYLSLILFFLFTNSFAQEAPAKIKRFSYGITLSPNISQLKVLDDQSNQLEGTAKLGIGVGITTKFHGGKHFFLWVGYRSSIIIQNLVLTVLMMSVVR